MVEIFQNQELNDICFETEALEEWKSIASELGMVGQEKLLKGVESPNPYPYMNKGMQIIFQTLCPTVINFQKYDKTPIPMEVLKQIKYSVVEKHFKEINIHFDDKAPDPIAVGKTYDYVAYDKAYGRLTNAEKQDVLFDSEDEAKAHCDLIGFKYQGVHKVNENSYLIARWGDELRPLVELRELAKSRLLETYGATIKNEIEEKQQALKKLTENVVLYLNGELTENQLKGSRW